MVTPREDLSPFHIKYTHKTALHIMPTDKNPVSASLNHLLVPAANREINNLDPNGQASTRNIVFQLFNRILIFIDHGPY